MQFVRLRLVESRDARHLYSKKLVFIDWLLQWIKMDQKIKMVRHKKAVDYMPLAAKVTLNRKRKSEGDFYLVLGICEIGSAI